MKKVTVEPFKVMGVKVRTSNENGQAAKDIPQLWEKFMAAGISEKIPNKIDPSILSIYANYEGDYTQPYDAILGCRVKSLDTIPDGLIGIEFAGGSYLKSTVKGDLEKGIVYNAWTTIWNQDLDRNYVCDFEVYGAKAQNPSNAEVDIFVGIN